MQKAPCQAPKIHMLFNRMSSPQLFYAASGSSDFADGQTTILLFARLLVLRPRPKEDALLGTVALLGSASFTLDSEPV